MCVQGKLGKNETGRVQALDVALRPRNSGLGACNVDLQQRKKKDAVCGEPKPSNRSLVRSSSRACPPFTVITHKRGLLLNLPEQ